MSGKYVTFLATLVVVTACSGASTSTTVEAAPATSRASTTTTEATTTTLALATTTTAVPLTTTTLESASEPLPDFLIESDDPVEALDELIEIYNWLWRNPEPELLNTAFTEESGTYDRILTRLMDLKQAGQFHDDPGFIVHSAEVDEWLVPDTVVILAVTVSWQPQVIRDSESVVEDSEGYEPWETRISLTNRLGTWRIVAIDGFPEVLEPRS